MRIITIIVLVLASTIVDAQPETDSIETDYSTYLKNHVHDIILSSITDTLKVEDNFIFKDYSISFSTDSVMIIVSKKRKRIVPIISDGWATRFYWKGKKDGIWVHTERKGVLVERWKKGVLKTRRWFHY